MPSLGLSLQCPGKILSRVLAFCVPQSLPWFLPDKRVSILHRGEAGGGSVVFTVEGEVVASEG